MSNKSRAEEALMEIEQNARRDEILRAEAARRRNMSPRELRLAVEIDGTIAKANGAVRRKRGVYEIIPRPVATP